MPKINLWKVYWWEEGKKKLRKFLSEKPTEAVTFAREIKRRGLSVEVVSGRKAYRPTEEQRLSREPGQLWCPYCVKYRFFKIFAIRRASYTTAPLLRCPVCTISAENYFVIKFNDFRGAGELLLRGTKYEVKVRRPRKK